jgi:hypothetical protein
MRPMNAAPIAAAAASAAMLLSQIPALAVLTTMRLTYAFTYAANQNITARDSPNSAEAVGSVLPNGQPVAGTVYTGAADNGISHYGGSLSDQGTMTVNIISKQPDGGIVVSISEAGDNIRRAPAATCVVYGNTTVMCDPNKTVYTEEYTLLRFLGANFVDPNQLDAKKHWSIAQKGNDIDVTADYTIDADQNGVMQIGETRTIKDLGVGHLTTDVETQIGYDVSRSVPVSVKEYAQQYTDAGINGTSRTTYQTTLRLLSSAPSQS